MDIHPCNDLHTFKTEHEDDSESEIIQLVKYFNLKTYVLQSMYSKADMMDNHPRKVLRTCKMEHDDYSESETFQVI